MAGKLSFSIAVNLLTENFKKGANTIKDSFKSIQMQIITFAAALGFAGFSLQGLVSRLIDTARATSRAITALKNVSSSTREFAENLKFINDTSRKYGLEVSALTTNFAKFTASAKQANIPMEQQKKVFESLSRASTAFGLSADDTNGVFLALSQMMGKGKISSEELRKQMGERIPIAMQAMAKAAGVSMAGLEKLLKQGKLMSSDIIPKFADALNRMIPNVDTDNIETSVNRLSNVFADFAEGAGVQEKYKALVDGLTSLLESATKNMQNIIVGIIAAIVFVVTSSLSKVYRSYASTGQQIIDNAKTTASKLRNAILAREEADKALELAKLRRAQATGSSQVAIAKEVSKARQILDARTDAVHKARINAQVAREQAAAIKSGGVWATTGAMIKGTFTKIGNALKSMWSSFAPAIIISGLIVVIGYFKNIYDEAKRIKNIFSEYKKEAKNVGNTQEVKMLEAQLSIMNDKTKSQEKINAAQLQLNKLLGVEGKNQAQLNNLVAKRIELLKEAARADYYARKSVEVEDKIGEMSASVGLDVEQVKKLATIRAGVGANNDYYAEVGRLYRANGTKGVYDVMATDAAVKEVIELMKVRRDADDQLRNSVDFANKNTIAPTYEPDDKELRAAQRAEDARRRMNESLRELDAERLKRQNEAQQKSIDLMDDSFDKRYAQQKLNYDKEYQSALEFSNKMLKEQETFAREQYKSKHAGSDVGFKVSDIVQSNLPSDLKTVNIDTQVQLQIEGASKTLEKARKEINNELKLFRQEQELLFESDLNKKLAELNTYYADEIKKAGKDEETISLLMSNHLKERQISKDQYNQRLIQLENEYKEKAMEVTTDLFFFQSDKEAALLKQKIENNKKDIASKEEEFKTLTGKEYDSLDDSQLQELFKTYPELVQAIRMAKEDQKGLNNELLKIPGKKLAELIGVFNELSGVIGSIAGVDFGMLNSALSGIASFASGDLKDAASSGLSMISGFVSGIINKKERQAQIQRELNKLQQEYNISLRQQNYDLISSVDYARAFRDNLEALQWLVEKGFISDVDYSAWEALRKQQERALENSDIATQKEKELLNLGREGLENLWKDRDGLKLINKQYVNILSDWKDGLISTEEAYRRLGTAGWKGMSDIADSINAASDETNKWGEELVEVQRQMDEMATSTSFDGFLGDAMNALHEWVKSGKSDISDLANFTEDTLSNAILSSFKYQILAKALKPLYENLSDYLINTPVDQIDKGWVDQWRDDFNKELAEKGGAINTAFDDLGIDANKSSSQSSSKGGFNTMTQDQAGKLTGRFTALHEAGLRMESIGLRMESIMLAISPPISGLYRQSITNGDELKKQTAALSDINQVVQKTYFLIEEGLKVTKTIKQDSEKLASIENNTKGLTRK